MFTIEMIKDELNRLSNSVDDKFTVPVRINGRLTSTLGRAIQIKRGTKYYPDRIEFSKKFLETGTEESIKSVIAHEWAHYYVTKTTHEHHGHDALFKSVCARVGCTDDKTTIKVERIVEKEQTFKYVVYCSKCGQQVATYSRMCPTLKNIKDYCCTLCDGTDLYYITNW